MMNAQKMLDLYNELEGIARMTFFPPGSACSQVYSQADLQERIRTLAVLRDEVEPKT